MKIVRPAAGLAAVVLLGSGLAGCGVADTPIRPGVAATVGDEDITLSEVDTFAADTCELLESNEGQAPIAGAAFRDQVLYSLVLGSMAEQIGADYDVDVAAARRQVEQTTREGLTGADPDLVDDVLPVFSGPDLFTAVLNSAVTSQVEEGTSGEEAQAAATELVQQWQDDNGVETNPRFASIDVASQEAGSVPELSVPVGEAATALDGELTPEQVAALPASQRCG